MTLEHGRPGAPAEELFRRVSFSWRPRVLAGGPRRPCGRAWAGKEDLGQLVALGFGFAAFGPAPYRRPRLGRPYEEFSSRGGLRA